MHYNSYNENKSKSYKLRSIMPSANDEIRTELESTDVLLIFAASLPSLVCGYLSNVISLASYITPAIFSRALAFSLLPVIVREGSIASSII